jgi:secreted Zn-dependent insulinase-like peptidase
LRRCCCGECDSLNQPQNVKAILPAVASWLRVAAAPASRASFLKFWDTSRRLALLSSSFPSIPRASELPQQLASNLLRLAHHDAVSLQWTWQMPDSDRVDSLFGSLQLGRCLMMLILPTNSHPVSFDGSVLTEQAALPEGWFNRTELWYGTPHLVTGVTPQQLQSLDTAGAHLDNQWTLPAGNRFAPEDMSLVSGDSDLTPSLVQSADTTGANPAKSQVWHARDNSFGSPKQVIIHFSRLSTSARV